MRGVREGYKNEHIYLGYFILYDLRIREKRSFKMTNTNKKDLSLTEALDFIYDTLGIDVYEEYETDNVTTVADELRKLYELKVCLRVTLNI